MNNTIKKAAAAALLLLMAATAARAQQGKLTIHMKSGTERTLPAADIESITFAKAKEQMFDLEVGGITEQSATASVTPKDATVKWAIACDTKAWFDQYPDLESLSKALKEKMEYQAYLNVMTLEEYLSATLVTGSDGNRQLDNLLPGTKHVAAVFGMTESGELTTPVKTAEFTTLETQKLDVSFDIDVQVDQENATVSVKPSDKEQAYVTYIMYKDEWEKYKQLGGNPLDQYLKYLTDLQGASKDVVINWYLGGAKVGDTQTIYKNLGPNEEWVAFAVAVDGNWLAVTDVAESSFTTGQRPQSDNRITITVDKISDDAATVTVHTTNADAWWPVLIQLPDDYFDDDRQMRQLIYEGASSGIEPVKTGDQTWEYWLSPGTEYGIAVAGVDETGYPNTAIVRTTFTTTGTPTEYSPKLRIQGIKRK